MSATPNGQPKMAPKPPAPKLSGQGEWLEVGEMRFPVVDPWSPTYRDIHEPFNAYKYTNPRLAIDLGKIDLAAVQDCPCILRMVLKWGGENNVAIPAELEGLRPLFKQVFEYDRIINKSYQEQFAHITIHNAEVVPGQTQRFPGWHGDDLQGGSFDPKVTAAHSYIVTSDPPTEICAQPFFIAHLNDKRENIFAEFDKQAREENVYKTRAGHLYLMDPYLVHRSPVVTQPCLRTFLRITFSTQDMLMPRSTPNPLFADKEDPAADAVHRDDWYWLKEPDTAICYHRYGLREMQDYLEPGD